jgi:UDP-glucuronate decarboxylase
MIDAFIRLMNLPEYPGGPVNLGNPHEVSMLEIARRIVDITGSPSPVAFRPLPIDDPWHRQPDITRATQLLAWQPTTSLDDGLAQTARYFSALHSASHLNDTGNGNARTELQIVRPLLS